MKIAVTGATGQLGSLVIKSLKTKVANDQIIALVRSVEKAESLGVAAREADYDQLEKLVEALEDVETLLLISSNEIGKRLSQHLNVINSAKKAGVKRIVYTSLLHADSSPLKLAEEHIATENEIKKSGLNFTILRNGWYSENYTVSIPGAIAGGGFIGSAGDGKISSATREDYAEAAALVLSENSHAGKIYELAGDEAYTLTELAAEISSATGKNVPYINLPEEVFKEKLISFGLPEGLADILGDSDAKAATNALFDDSKQLATLIKRPTTPWEDSVKEVVKSLDIIGN